MRPNAYEETEKRELESVECQQIFLCWTGRRRGAPSPGRTTVISTTQNTTWVKTYADYCCLFSQCMGICVKSIAFSFLDLA